MSSTVNQGQANPVAGHWYSFTALSLDVPIGAWQLSYEAVAFASNRDVFVALSNTTATDSVSDADLIAYSQTTATELSATFHREKYVAQSAKTTWYLKLKVDQANVSQINFGASTGAATVIRAVCAYL